MKRKALWIKRLRDEGFWKKEFWRKVEETNNKLIPLAIVLLLFIIIAELYFHVEGFWHSVVKAMDTAVIVIFVIDLIFLALKSKNARYFFRHYWLDVLAVFPFGILFRVMEQVQRGFIATERFALAQSIFHETLEVEKEAKGAVRVERLVKPLRIGTRLTRVVTKSRLFSRFRRNDSRARSKLYSISRLYKT